MKKYLLFSLLAMALLAANAQEGSKGSLSGKILGKVIDSASGMPLDYATITLQQIDNGKQVNGSTTDKSGRFSISDIAPGSYTLLAEFIGYEPYKIEKLVVDKGNLVIDLKNIALSKKQTTLQTVTVTASGGRLIDNKIDRLVYNAEKDITAQSGVATDILKKVPQVSVDVNGNVELAGNAGIRFLINGKPSAAFGSNIADVLQSIPASQIKSIEVVTNPGAKYDAQGMGGIINIILKKSTAQGINGNLSLAAGTRVDNGSFNFNARKNNFDINAFISGNYRPAANAPTTTDRRSTDTGAKTIALLHQDGASHFNREGFQSGLGFDWTYKEKNNFTGSLSYDRFGNKGNGYINQSQEQRSESGNILSSMDSKTYTNSSFHFNNVDAELNYKRTFTREDQELEIDIATSLGNNHTTSDNYQVLMPANTKFYGNRSTNPGKENETEVQVDYTQPLKEDVLLGIGGKFNNIDIVSNANVLSFQSAAQNYVPDPFLSNSLDYHQKVYAAYSELSLPVGKLFDAKVGGRYERTEINSYYSNAQQQTKVPGYNTFVPSIFFSRKLGENSVLKLSYSKRIERPDYGDLNPFINTSDPKNITSGNPYLLPEIGHRAELGYSGQLGKLGSFMATVFYRMNNQDIQPFIRYYSAFKVGDSTYTNVAVTTRENIGTEKNTGVNLFVDLHPTDKLSVRSNLFFFHRYTINTQDKGYNSTSFNYRFNLNATYQFSNTIVAEFFGNFNSARHEAQGRYPSFTTYSMAVRKQFWNKKGSLALTANNFLKNYAGQKTEVFGPNFFISNYRQVPFRSFGINFTWKFGRLEFKKDKEETDNMAAPADNQ